MTTREKILQEAMALPFEDREFLVEHLEDSLQLRGFASPEIATAWTSEIDRRIAAYDRGEIQASEAEEAIERMRRYLADHRARKVNS